MRHPVRGLLLSALVLLAVGSFVAITTGQVPLRSGGSRQKAVARAVKHDRSPRLRDIAPVAPTQDRAPWEREPAPRHRGRGARGFRVDTAVQEGLIPATIPEPSESFDGLGNVNAVLPPDTIGDVGPNHYIQWVNLSFVIYAKGSGAAPPTLIYGPAAGSTLWSGFGGPCESTNNGDPIVLYDHLADRWVMSQLALPNNFLGILLLAPFYQCIAVSATPDPMGAYNRYQFEFTKLNDYPKLGVWPDAYYMGINQFTELTLQYAGQGVVAFDRASMLAGQPASMVYFDLASRDINLGGMLPADLDGPPPPAGSPGYFVQVDDDAWGYSPDQLQLWRFSVDWANPSASSFIGPSVIPVAPFDSDLCGYARNCLPQPGTGVGLDTLADRLMYRLQYRNFGGHESLVVNHTVDASGNDHAGIRWYEIRDPRTSPTLFQQGTYAPDANHRWMASAAMDRVGNMALGFSVTGPGTFPSIRYAGRLATDPPGVLSEGETTLLEGSGSQTHSSGRWGDYSMMVVDPTDDCTFWYTQQYYASTSSMGWRTRIGVFSFPSCGGAPDVPRVTVSATGATVPEAGAGSGTFTVRRTGDTAAPMMVAYTVAGSAHAGSDYVALSGSVVIPVGETTAPIAVMPIDDAIYEGNETVLVTIGEGPGYRVGSPASAVVTIQDNEVPPDLIVPAVSAPTGASPGESITVTDSTRNQGTGPAAASTTGFYLSADTVFDAADRFLGGRPVPPLGAGSSSDNVSTSVDIPATAAAGTYYVIGRADANLDVAESDEANNAGASAAVRVGSDLIVSALSAPSSAAAGASILVTDTTSNQGGGGTVIASTTRFYVSSDALLDAGDTSVGSRTIQPLAAGAASTAATAVVVPANLTPGLYYLHGKADSENVVSEIVETNNVRTASTIKVGPDLTVSGVTAPATAAAGATIVVGDTTRNTGAGAAGASTTTYYFSTNSLLDAADEAIGSRPVPALAANGSHTGSGNAQIPANAGAGTYYVLAKADGTNAVAEGIESNNTSSAVAVRLGADLIVSSITAPGMAAAGATISVGDTTRNQGAGAAPGSTTVVYLSANATWDAGDRSLGGRSVPALASGASHAGSTSVQIPANTTTGTYYLIAKADGANAIGESVETNNASSAASVRIGPDLSVSGLTGPSWTGAGATITVGETTRNTGAGAAPASTTQFYLSPNALLDASDELLGGRPVPPLAQGATDAASTPVQIPPNKAAGLYYLFAKADGNNAIVEANEANNSSSAVTLRIGPDLVMSTLTVPGAAAAGAAIDVTDTTLNQGGGAAQASTTRFYLSTNFTFDAADRLLGGRSVAALAAGQSESGTISITIPSGTAPGSYYILAVADGEGAVAEAFETNNSLFRFIQISAP